MEIKMFYGEYKINYSDCKTVSGSYDKNEKSIIVIVPDNRDMDKAKYAKRSAVSNDLNCSFDTMKAWKKLSDDTVIRLFKHLESGKAIPGTDKTPDDMWKVIRRLNKLYNV